MVRLSLEDRRRTIGRSLLQLTNKAWALTANEKQSLRSLIAEAEDIEDDIQANTRRKYARAYSTWLRFGMDGVRPEERSLLREFRDMGTGGQAAGPGATAGFFVPADFYAKVSSALAFYGPMLDPDVVTIHETTEGAPKGYPEDNDTTIAGEQLEENAQATEEDIQGLSSVVLKAFRYSSKLVKCSIALAQDTGFDLDAYLADRFAIRIARAVNPKLTTGVGTVEPFGVVTQATLGAVANGSAANTGADDGANTLGTGDFAALEKSVDFAYRANAKFMMHPNTLSSLRQALDKTGRSLFPELHVAGEDTISGFPVVLNPAMDQLQANPSSPPVTRKTVLYGDFSKFVVRRVTPIIQRLEERFIDFGQYAYIMHQRLDGNLIDGSGGAVKYLANVY